MPLEEIPNAFEVMRRVIDHAAVDQALHRRQNSPAPNEVLEYRVSSEDMIKQTSEFRAAVKQLGEAMKIVKKYSAQLRLAFLSLVAYFDGEQELLR